MVNIDVSYHNQQFKKLKMSGHANAGKKGSDLVCAALTGIISGALNAFETKCPADVTIKITENTIVVEIINQTPTLMLMFEMLMIQLKTIIAQYPKNVQLKEVD